MIAMTYGSGPGVAAAAGRFVPKYQAVADDLLAKIRAGVYGPGDRIPTEQGLMATYKVSITTARNAVSALAKLGVVETRQGTGTFVVERTLLRINATHTEDLDRRKGITAQDSWSTDVLAAGRAPAQRFECLNVPAAKEIAALMDIAEGDPMVMRRCWRTVDGTPASVESALYPAWLVAEVPLLASPHDITQGTTSYLADQGHPMLWHEDRLSSRPPTREEASWFEAPASVSVLVRFRISFDVPGGRVMRAMETAYRSDMHEVVYDVAGRGNPVVIPNNNHLESSE